MKRNFIKNILKRALILGLITLSCLSFSPLKVNAVEYGKNNSYQIEQLSLENRDMNTVENQMKYSLGTICLDLAHNDLNSSGTIDNGATYKNYNERVISNRISMKVGKKLQQKGYYVKYTRPYDKPASLKDRIRIGNEYNYDLYFSLHLNSCEVDNSAKGCEAFTNGKGWSVANNISKNIKPLGINNRKICSTPYYTKNIKGSTVLFELGFINNDKEIENIINNEDAIVDAIVDGIIEGIK